MTHCNCCLPSIVIVQNDSKELSVDSARNVLAGIGLPHVASTYSATDASSVSCNMSGIVFTPRYSCCGTPHDSHYRVIVFVPASMQLGEQCTDCCCDTGSEIPKIQIA